MKFGPARKLAREFTRYGRSSMLHIELVRKYEPYKQRANDETCAILRRALKQETANG